MNPKTRQDYIRVLARESVEDLRPMLHGKQVHVRSGLAYVIYDEYCKRYTVILRDGDSCHSWATPTTNGRILVRIWERMTGLTPPLDLLLEIEDIEGEGWQESPLRRKQKKENIELLALLKRTAIASCLCLVTLFGVTDGAKAATAYGSAMYVDSVSVMVPSGYPTCSGAPYYGHEYIAAAGNLINGGFYPIGTVLNVYNPQTGLSTNVVVTDCTPNAYPAGNFDISYPAALDIGLAPYQGRSYDMVVTPVDYVDL